MEPILECRDLTKNTETNYALYNLNLSLERGQIVGLLGPNGSGKTTLLRILGGFLDADEGSVIFDGEEISKKTAL